MTLRKPDEPGGRMDWLLTGWNSKNLLFALAAIVGLWYAQGTRVTVVEQQTGETKKQFEEVNRRIDLNMNAVQHLRDTKVEKDSYDADQKRIAEELSAIQLSVGRIEQILMEKRP